MTGVAKVAYGFVSFTEVAPGEHRNYNAWHLFDHLPEQLPIPGIVHGQRWVLSPTLRACAHHSDPLDRVHYATLYLLAEPVDDTLDAFFALAVALRAAGRFHEHRTSHLSGPIRLVSTYAAPHALVRPEAIPYRPHRGVHVRIGGRPVPDDHAGVAGTWSFFGDERAPEELQGQHITWSWLDGGPEALAPDLADSTAVFSATLTTVDPFGDWAWFD